MVGTKTENTHPADAGRQKDVKYHPRPIFPDALEKYAKWQKYVAKSAAASKSPAGVRPQRHLYANVERSDIPVFLPHRSASEFVRV